MIPGDTKKSSSSPSPTIIKINHQNNQKSSGRSRTASSSSSTNNNRNSTRSYPRTGTLPVSQHHDTRDFVRNVSARSSTMNPQQAANAPPRPYKSPDLYANTRSFKTDPRNQVLPSPTGGTLPNHANPTTYATVMSNQRTMQYKEERVNGELVSQSVHKQERMNHA